ncbi:hypothetical protein CU097_003892 [Rhizopus azygosporus]|uniref:Uncharacterized protein n=1 Tax=Rhizopus azygosporus TaxID=86630 RepID=A0A367JLJ5_RHIAZ|nr:hypothetical protein CU097_003892 [Rhizopus azygosporus]
MSCIYQSYTSITKEENEETSITASVTIHEVTETEASRLPLEEKAQYEILDEDRLTEHDFISLMDGEDTESEDDSDVEYTWFPSLMKSSVIQFLEDEDESLNNLMVDDIDHTDEAIVEEHDGMEDIEQDVFDHVPVEVYHITV